MSETTTNTRITLSLEEINAEEHRGRHPLPLEREAYEQHHYLATLIRGGKRATFRFTTGSAWERPPAAREVLESVLSDASIVDEYDGPGELAEAFEYGDHFNAH